jgi:hypothetical protein
MNGGDYIFNDIKSKTLCRICYISRSTPLQRLPFGGRFLFRNISVLKFSNKCATIIAKPLGRIVYLSSLAAVSEHLVFFCIDAV